MKLKNRFSRCKFNFHVFIFFKLFSPRMLTTVYCTVMDLGYIIYIYVFRKEFCQIQIKTYSVLGCHLCICSNMFLRNCLYPRHVTVYGGSTIPEKYKSKGSVFCYGGKNTPTRNSHRPNTDY